MKDLSASLRAYILLVAIGGAIWLGYLVAIADWDGSILGETGLFFLLIVVAGSFPLSVAPTVKADMATAVLFGAALVLEPGPAALAASVGMVTYTFLLRFWGERLHIPWYKYPFNGAATAFSVGLTSLVFHELATDGALITPAVAGAAAVKYTANTALVTGAASIQTGTNPLRFWWMGTKENGPTELSLIAFGLLGALVYRESPWSVVALVIPVGIVYFAFSRLAATNGQLHVAMDELKSLQGRIAYDSKLASVGAMSLEMAHQIKNPLTILLGNLEALEAQLANSGPHQRKIKAATKAGWRIDELTRSFSLPGEHKPGPVDVHDLLTDAYGMAVLYNSTGAEVRLDCEAGVAEVSGDRVLLREAVSNLFANAMEAAGAGGIVSADASRANGSVVVRITDNGPGVPREIMDHLFEPFHTTKPEGSGLGLFSTKHILEMYQGGLKVESEKGQGTCVTVTLPARLVESESPDDIPAERNGSQQRSTVATS